MISPKNTAPNASFLATATTQTEFSHYIALLLVRLRSFLTLTIHVPRTADGSSPSRKAAPCANHSSFIIHHSSFMKSYHRYTIEGWMLTELGLDGSELVLYAILYQLTKREPKRWNYTHLAKYTGIPLRTVFRLTKDLREHGLLFIEKKPHDYSFIFRAVHQKGIVVNPAILAEDYLPTPVVCQNGQEACQIGQEACQIDEKESTKEKEENYNVNCSSGQKIELLPTATTTTSSFSVSWDEILAYANSRGFDRNEVEKFYAYYSGNGWMLGRNPMKNWRASLSYWMRKQHKPTAQPVPEDYKARAEHLRQQSIIEDQRHAREVAEARTPEARAAAEEFFKRFG